MNYTNKDGLCAATLVGYANAISIMFTLQGFLSPIDPSDPNNMGGIIITNHKKRRTLKYSNTPSTLQPSKAGYNGSDIPLRGLQAKPDL